MEFKSFEERNAYMKHARTNYPDAANVALRLGFCIPIQLVEELHIYVEEKCKDIVAEHRHVRYMWQIRPTSIAIYNPDNLKPVEEAVNKFCLEHQIITLY